MTFLGIITGVVKSSAIYILHFLSRAIPRKKHIWIYSGIAGKFNDNSKYFFLYAHQRHPHIRHIWLCPDTDQIAELEKFGFECYYKNSFRGIILSLRAKVFIYSAYITDVCHLSLTGGAFLFNLYHGVPLKKIEFDIYKGPLRAIFNPAGFPEKLKRFIQFPPLAKKHSAVLITSPFLKKIFSSALRLKEDDILVAQYPRVTPFFWTTDELNTHITRFESIAMQQLVTELTAFDQVWIYMPTWRDSNPSFVAEALKDFDQLNFACKQNNILLLLKMHINTRFQKDITGYSNIKLIDRTIDVYPLLPLTHTLVTDYSSILFDYSILKKRIIFYAFDLEKYLSGSREFYFDYKSIIQGRECVYSFEELIALIRDDNGVKKEYPVYDNFISLSSDFDAPFRFISRRIGIKT